MPRLFQFSAVILAGGASRRMGRDKSWLTVEGQTLLERQVAIAQAAGAAEVLISGAPGADYSTLACPVLFDKYPQCGPLGGIERGLAAAKEDLIVFMAVDMPRTSPEFLDQLLDRCAPGQGAVPVLGGRIEPLLAAYPKSSHSLAQAMLEARQLAVTGFARACAQAGLVSWFPVPQEAFAQFANWNRPEDIGS
jgi:molybdenum cofactor guanylyltransferase